MRLTIGFKLIALSASLVALVSAAFVFLGTQMLSEVYADQSARLVLERETNMDRRTSDTGARLSETLAEALAGHEIGRLHRVLSRVAEDSEIIDAAIADASGVVLVRSDQALSDTLAARQPLERAPHSDRRDVITAVRRDGRTLGSLRLSWSLAGLRSDLDAISRKRRRDMQRATTSMVVAGIIAVSAGILAGIFGGLALSRPVRRLAMVARSLASGDLDARADLRSADEIGDLAETMNHMASQIGNLLADAKTHAEIARELAVARQIQEGMLPPQEPVSRPGLELFGVVEPATECGGDWWAHLPLTRQRTLVLIGDVTGHGISSAMLTATARACVDTVNQLTKGDLRPGYLLEVMDQLIREQAQGDFHMTCFASVFDPLESSLVYANAGHNHPFLLRHTPDGWRQGRLAARGNRLGDADGYRFVEHTVSISAKDLLCWYTDGLVEAQADGGREFGIRRLRRCLDQASADEPAKVVGHILSELHSFLGQAALSDDVSCVVGRVA